MLFVLFGITLLALFRGSLSSYQWRCSTLNAENKYYLPNFGGREQVKRFQYWQPSFPGTTYIYRVNESMLNCSGTVSAVEFCYMSSNNRQSKKVFTLLLINNNLQIKKSISVNRFQECNTSKCCDIMTLQHSDRLKTPKQFAYIGVRSEPGSNLPGLFYQHSEFTTQSYFITGPLPRVDHFINSLGRSTTQTLRLMWLHITNDRDRSSNDPLTSSFDHPSTEATTSSSTPAMSPGLSAGVSNATIAGGTIGSVFVLFIAAMILLISILCVLYRRRNFKPNENGREIVNNIYNIRGIATQEAIAVNKLEYDYSKVGPSAGAAKKEEKLLCLYTDENETSPYATANISSQPMNFAEYDDYTVPANNIVGLYEQLDIMMTDDVTRHNIILGKRLGSGQFGDVYNGVWERRHDSLKVAVKTLKEGSSDDGKVKFLQEAAIMAQFKHHNVVTMYGLVKDREPVLLILEMLEKGDLRNYLLSMKTNDGGVSSEIDGHELLSYCRQVASGMVYLSNKAFVHRDLAARNILVSDDRICKIADFGMSRDLADENYYVSHGGLIPVKWTAPEALFYKKYSTASDVWSYGAVMYEIWSIGHKPFENVLNSEVIKMITSGYRLPPPPGCPRAIYNIMMSCWNPEPSERPSFNDLSTRLSVSNSKLLHKDKSDFSAASILGATLSCGEALYEDLQNMYKKQN